MMNQGLNLILLQVWVKLELLVILFIGIVGDIPQIVSTTTEVPKPGNFKAF